MKHIGLLLLAAVSVLTLAGCSQTQSKALLDGKSLDGWTMYLKDPDVDPAAVWSLQDGVLHCKGKPNGYIRTAEAYSNYTLHLEWRWTEKPTNSGVLLHITGEDKIWPKCIEGQLQNQNAGDFYAIGGTGFAELKTGTRAIKQHESNEKEAGQWNSYDIVCKDDTITLTVNGLLQNTATQTSVSAGTIGLQSEGSPIEFRNITITPLP